jgi:hypothetical protein
VVKRRPGWRTKKEASRAGHPSSSMEHRSGLMIAIHICPLFQSDIPSPCPIAPASVPASRKLSSIVSRMLFGRVVARRDWDEQLGRRLFVALKHVRSRKTTSPPPFPFPFPPSSHPSLRRTLGVERLRGMVCCGSPMAQPSRVNDGVVTDRGRRRPRPFRHPPRGARPGPCSLDMGQSREFLAAARYPPMAASRVLTSEGLLGPSTP